MKLIFYGVSAVEAPLIAAWTQRTGISVVSVPEALDATNIDLTRGCTAICFYPSIAMQQHGEWFYRRLKANGIKHLALKSTGVDGIDFTLVHRLGLTVSNVPGYSPTSVGHFAVMSILMALRRLPAGLHQAQRRSGPGRELGDVTVGIIGTGRIGSVVATALVALGGHVIAYSHHRTPQLEGLVTYCGLDELLAGADVVSLHVPLTPATHHLLDEAAFAKMRPDTMIVNTARGGIIDTPALIAALQAHHLGGAVLDTIENEARYFATGWADNPYCQALAACDNVLVTPHVAYYTKRAVQEITETVLANAAAASQRRGAANMITG